MKNIFLIGFMGTGKSTIAHKLSEISGMSVWEMDEEIAKKEHCSIPEIFETHGESYFRQKETELLMELHDTEHIIVSCGGGTVLRECNVTHMRSNGSIIWLTAEAETIYQRVKDDENRPLLKGNMSIEYIQKMMSDRYEKYLDAADYVIKTDKRDITEICMEILEKIKGENENV